MDENLYFQDPITKTSESAQVKISPEIVNALLKSRPPEVKSAEKIPWCHLCYYDTNTEEIYDCLYTVYCISIGYTPPPANMHPIEEPGGGSGSGGGRNSLPSMSGRH